MGRAWVRVKGPKNLCKLISYIDSCSGGRVGKGPEQESLTRFFNTTRINNGKCSKIDQKIGFLSIKNENEQFQFYCLQFLKLFCMLNVTVHSVFVVSFSGFKTHWRAGCAISRSGVLERDIRRLVNHPVLPLYISLIVWNIQEIQGRVYHLFCNFPFQRFVIDHRFTVDRYS